MQNFGIAGQSSTLFGMKVVIFICRDVQASNDHEAKPKAMEDIHVGKENVSAAANAAPQVCIYLCRNALCEPHNLAFIAKAT